MNLNILSIIIPYLFITFTAAAPSRAAQDLAAFVLPASDNSTPPTLNGTALNGTNRTDVYDEDRTYGIAAILLYPENLVNTTFILLVPYTDMWYYVWDLQCHILTTAPDGSVVKVSTETYNCPAIPMHTAQVWPSINASCIIQDTISYTFHLGNNHKRMPVDLGTLHMATACCGWNCLDVYDYADYWVNSTSGVVYSNNPPS